MDIDDLIYSLLPSFFPEYEEGEILDIIEEFKQPRGLDEDSEFEQEVWQKYCTLKRILKRQFAGGSNAEASQPRSVAAKAQLPQDPGDSLFSFLDK